MAHQLNRASSTALSQKGLTSSSSLNSDESLRPRCTETFPSKSARPVIPSNRPEMKIRLCCVPPSNIPNTNTSDYRIRLPCPLAPISKLHIPLRPFNYYTCLPSIHPSYATHVPSYRYRHLEEESWYV